MSLRQCVVPRPGLADGQTREELRRAHLCAALLELPAPRAEARRPASPLEESEPPLAKPNSRSEWRTRSGLHDSKCALVPLPSWQFANDPESRRHVARIWWQTFTHRKTQTCGSVRV